MRLTSTRLATLAAASVLALAACGDAGGGDDEGSGPEVEVAEDAAEQFDDGTRMKELAEDGTIRIGVKFDQPGIGVKDPTEDIPSGFDIEIAKILAADLGLDGDDTSQVEWVETISDNREPFLQEDEVDLVIASYSITDERRAIVGQAGPYYITGQQVLVPADSDVESIDDLAGEEVCSVTGSTSLENVEAAGAVPRGFDTYTECRDQVLDGVVPAMSTDGSILLGYAALNPDELKVVGEEFSEERYGVGYSLEAPEMCEWINETIQEAYDDGTWAEAFEATLGEGGADTPEPPTPDDCPAA